MGFFFTKEKTNFFFEKNEGNNDATLNKHMIFFMQLIVRSTKHSNYCACNRFLVFSAVYQLVSIYTVTYCNVSVSFELSSRDKNCVIFALNINQQQWWMMSAELITVIIYCSVTVTV